MVNIFEKVKHAVVSETIVADVLPCIQQFTPSLSGHKKAPEGILKNYEAVQNQITKITTRESSEQGTFYNHKVYWIGKKGEEKRPVYIGANFQLPDSVEALKNWEQPDLIFHCHLDTASGSEESVKKAKFEDGYINGPGSLDMKGPGLMGIYALTGAPKTLRTAIVFDTNEETTSADIKYLIEELNFAPKVAICPDGSPIPEGKGLVSLVTHSKHILQSEYSASTRGVHSAHMPEDEKLLIVKVSQFLLNTVNNIKAINRQRGIPAEGKHLKAITINPIYPNAIGTKKNTTADEATIDFDTRMPKVGDIELVKGILRELAEIYGFNLVEERVVSGFGISKNHPYIKLFRRIGEGLGFPVKFNKDFGGNYLTTYSRRTRKILNGVRGDNSHGDLDEKVSVEALLVLADIYIQFAKEFAEYIYS